MCCSYRICGKRFMQLAKWTVKCFPEEFVVSTYIYFTNMLLSFLFLKLALVQETYYIPSNERGKGRSASGKLYDAYTNLNKELRKVNLRKSNFGQSFQSLSSSELYIAASIPTLAEAGNESR